MAKRFIFTGHVQGVGFRYTTAQIAARLAVEGFVRNLLDGSVELVVKGSPNTIQAFVDEICRSMAGNIDNVEANEIEHSESIKGFEIRR